MEVEAVIAALLELFQVERITPSQYAAAVHILSKLEMPKDLNLKIGEMKHENTKE